MPSTTRRPTSVAACCASVLDAPLKERDAQELASAFAALSDPVRLRLLSLIAAEGEICACDLVAPVGKSQPTVSHHLKVLHEAGLVERDKRGTWMWYRVVPARLSQLRDVLG
ncbi:MAG: helix-turn-helix transcriptional regulator [Actinobacteria bacterium]|nr:MAG: helix-turn-helix transcriptional regulator [Actinomycetota bacterium]